MYSSFPEDMFLATLCKVFDLLDSMELANQYTGANSVIPCINKQSVLDSNAIGQPCSAIYCESAVHGEYYTSSLNC